jgi:hypothetical protein
VASSEQDKQLRAELARGLGYFPASLAAEDVARYRGQIADQKVCEGTDPGQVLVSSTVKDLVVGSGLRFGDRGECALKGVPDTWRLFAVTGDDENQATG